jgi:hypothetical protein
VQHFEDVLNSNNVRLENHIHPSEAFEESVEMAIDEMDVESSIRKLKNFKAPGTDGLQAELFIYGGDILNKYLYKLISETGTKEETPADWKVGLICPIYKKDHLITCKNDRGITLANEGYKIFSKILFRKLEPVVKENV